MTDPDTSDAQSICVTINKTDSGGRLDRVLATHVGTMSRSRLKALIKDGRVSVSGAVTIEPNRSVNTGETYTVEIPAAEPPIPKGEDIPLDVLFEDAAVIVLNKPAGLVVHPAAGNWNGTLVNALIAHCGDSLSGIGGVKRPGIVHRLDKDTSGVMVVAKTDAAHAALTAQFASHGRDGRLQRAYEAVVWGTPDRPRGSIDAALGRATGNRTKMAVVRADRDDAKHAVTRYECLETFATEAREDAASLIRCVLETGRTHQIRVHMAHVGHPLLGDPTYGAGYATSSAILGEQTQHHLKQLRRQALHAVRLGFEHPATGEPMLFDCPPPTDMAALIEALRTGA